MAVFEGAASHVLTRLRNVYGVKFEDAFAMTRIFDDVEKTRVFMIDAAGRDFHPWVTVDGEVVPGIKPALYIDFLNRAVPFPNIRQIRRQASVLTRMKNAPVLLEQGQELKNLPKMAAIAGGAVGVTLDEAGGLSKAGAAAVGKLGASATWTRDAASITADVLMRVWKPAQLLRPAWTVRVVGEEQVRMAMSGHESMFSHPMHFVTRILRGGETDALGADFVEAARKAANDGDLNAYTDAMSQGIRMFLPDNDDLMSRRMAGYRVLNRESDPVDFPNAWHDYLARMSTDPVIKPIAGMTPFQARTWFWSGDGAALRREMAAGEDDLTGMLNTPNGSNDYIDFLFGQIDQVTASDPMIRKALATGELEDVGRFMTVKDGKIVRGSEANEHLRSLARSGWAPDNIPGKKFLPANDYQKAGESLNRGLSFLFDELMTKRTDYLSRSPEFRQSYWDRIAELAPALSPDDRLRALRQAETMGGFHTADIPVLGKLRPGKSGPRRAIDALQDASGPGGHLTLEEADTVAKAYGLNETKALLYDLSQKSQFFDIWRAVFPFGEAWKEVLTRWVGIVAENPQTVRKFQVGIQGARGAGFFYTDPTTGEEIFNYPGSEWVTKATLGNPIPLSGSVGALNLVSSGLPGVGPVVQIPAAYFLPDTPTWDSLREIISPFGDDLDESGNPLFTAAKAVMPSWADKLLTATFATDADRDFMNATMAQAAYLRSTGKYGASPEEQRRMLTDAKDMARKFFLIRTFASAVAPSAPIPRMQIEDRDGDLFFQRRLGDELRKEQELAEAEGRPFDDADVAFVKRYGENAYAAMQPITRALVFRLPVTKKQLAWERSNPDIASKYPNVYGYFAPPDPDGKFDLGAYQRQVKNGQRQPLSPKTWQQLSNDRVANLMYQQEKKAIGDDPDDEDADYLREFKKILVREYPGYENVEGIMTRGTEEASVEQMKLAVKDPKLAKTPAAKGIRIYLDARDEVIAEAANLKKPIVGWQTAKGTADLRRYLSETQKIVAREYPAAESAMKVLFAGDVQKLEG